MKNRYLLISLLFLFSIYSCEKKYESTNTDLQLEFFQISKNYRQDSYSTILQCDQLLKKVNRSGDNNLISMIYWLKGYSFYLLNQTNQSRECYFKGMEYGSKSYQKSGYSLNMAFWGLQLVELNMHKRGEKSIDNAIKLIHKTNQIDKFRNYALGLLYNIHHIVNTNYSTQQSDLEKSLVYFKNTPEWQNKEENVFINYHNTGLLKLSHHDYKGAFAAFKLSENYSKESQSILYYGYAQYYYDTGDYRQAIKFASKAITLNRNKLGAIPLCTILENSYQSLDDIHNAKKYSDIGKKLQRDFDLNRLKVASQLYELENKNINQLSIIHIIFYAVGFIVIASLLLLALHQYKKNRKKTLNFRLENDKNKKIEAPVSSQNIDINEDTEQRILQELQKFEQKELFLEKSYTAGKLASYAGTNVRYITEVIKKHKAENFNLYINNLKIEYIVHKLETDSQYRKYKISYLAEKAGFSSPPLFTKIFSSIRGITPSEYLKKMQNKD